MALGACVAAIGLGGCGGEEDQTRPSEASRTARQVALQWVTARNSDEYELLCGLYTDEIRAELENGYGSCEKFYSEAVKRPVVELSVTRLQARGNEAEATLSSGPTFYALGLNRSRGRWAVSVLGP